MSPLCTCAHVVITIILQIYQQQNGVDCGIHVMHNLEEIAKVILNYQELIFMNSVDCLNKYRIQLNNPSTI